MLDFPGSYKLLDFGQKLQYATYKPCKLRTWKPTQKHIRRTCVHFQDLRFSKIRIAVWVQITYSTLNRESFTQYKLTVQIKLIHSTTSQAMEQWGLWFKSCFYEIKPFHGDKPFSITFSVNKAYTWQILKLSYLRDDWLESEQGFDATASFWRD